MAPTDNVDLHRPGSAYLAAVRLLISACWLIGGIIALILLERLQRHGADWWQGTALLVPGPLWGIASPYFQRRAIARLQRECVVDGRVNQTLFGPAIASILVSEAGATVGYLLLVLALLTRAARS